MALDKTEEKFLEWINLQARNPEMEGVPISILFEAYEQGMAQKPTSIWIDPLVRLPEHEQYILIRTSHKFWDEVPDKVFVFNADDDTIEHRYYDHDGCDFDGVSIVDIRITGWTPLPSPGD